MKFRLSSLTYCFLLVGFGTYSNVFSKSDIRSVDIKQRIESVKGVDSSVLISRKQKDEEFPIEKAIALAYSNNPQIKTAVAAKMVADEQLAQVFSEFYPTITAKLSTGIESSRAQHNDTNTKMYKHSMGVDFVLNLYGDGTLTKLDKVHLALIAERYNYIKIEQDILLRTVSAFMDVWSAAEQVKIYEKMRNNFKECVEFSEAHLKAGLSKYQDLASFKASYSDAEYKLTNAKAALKSAKALLAQYIGKKPKGVVVIPSFVIDIPSDIKLLKQEAEKRNAGLLAEKYKADAANVEISVQASCFSPLLNLEGGIERGLIGKNRTTTNSGVTFGNHEKNDTYNAGFVVTMPIWKNSTSGGANPYSAVRKAKMESTAASFNVANVRNSLLSDVSKSWYSLVASKAQIDQSIAAVKSAEVSVDGYREQEKLGASSATDVVYNENKLLAARLQYVEARKKYIVSAYQIKSILGEITPDFEKYSIEKHDITSNENFVKYAPVSTKVAKIK